MADFQENLEDLRAAGAEVVALSVDSKEDAEKTVRRHGLEYPVLYGLDAKRIAEQIGAYIDEKKGHVQATGVVLKPGGKVALAVYSSGPVGRLVAGDTIGLVKYLSK